MSQNEKIFGIHTVESLLEKSPEKIIQLFLQKNRHDKKFLQIENLAKNAGASFSASRKT